MPNCSVNIFSKSSALTVFDKSISDLEKRLAKKEQEEAFSAVNGYVEDDDYELDNGAKDTDDTLNGDDEE